MSSYRPAHRHPWDIVITRLSQVVGELEDLRLNKSARPDARKACLELCAAMAGRLLHILPEQLSDLYNCLPQEDDSMRIILSVRYIDGNTRGEVMRLIDWFAAEADCILRVSTL